jgi:Fe-S cluster assembly protein SufD
MNSTSTANGAGLAAAFDQHMVTQAATPAWWQQMKKRAYEAYRALPMPTRKNEQWRFATINVLNLEGFDFSAAASEADRAALADQAALVSQRAGRVVFADNQLVRHDRVSADLEKRGVIWAPLSEALTKHGDILQEYFMAQEPHLGSEKFAALHSAFVSAGCLLYVPKGVEIELPFIARHWAATAGAAILPHTLVIAGDNSRVSLVDVFASRDRAQRNLACGFNHLFAGNGARIDYHVLQNWSDATLGFQINSLVAQRDATINSLAVNIGGSHYRSETHSILKGQGSHAEMLSLSVTDHDQEVDQRTLQTHLAPNTKSNLLFKNALGGDSRTIFSGIIRVAEDAQKTDAYQSNRNLLLSDTAEANSLPGLEIQANDVRCTHGATTGQIDETELFYMLARGIDKRAARELLVFGFFEEVISQIQNEELATRVRELIQQKFRDEESRRG